MNASGALLAARVGVLAAEVADTERFRRGRAYARSGAVRGTAVVDGVLTGQVQGTRPESYVVELRVRARGGGRRGPVPARHDVQVRCTCPDDAPVCKHAVAVLLSFAQLVGDDPQLLVDWTGTPLDAPAVADLHDPEPDDGVVMPEFFGARTPGDVRLPTLEPLLVGERPVAAGDLTQLALDALDHAHRALHALYG